MSLTFDDIRAREAQHVLQNYKRQPVALVRGKASRVWDVAGREYIDLISGIGVTSLGHAHPGLSAAIAEQAATLLHEALQLPADDGPDGTGGMGQWRAAAQRRRARRRPTVRPATARSRPARPRTPPSS